jgi:hypothetical protein
MFCERCAALTRRLSYDPAAQASAELLSGSCMWRDEIAPGWCSDCIGKTREVFHLRYQMTVGEPVPAEAVAVFLRLEQQFPRWPLFRPERRSPQIAKQVWRMVHRNRRQACVALARLDREIRSRQAEEKQ